MRPWIQIALPLMLLACGEPVPENLGEYCAPIAERLCPKCAGASEQASCIAGFTDACCDGNCAARFLSQQVKSRSAWNDCLDAYDDLPTCDDVLTLESAPAECQVMWEVAR